MNQKMEALKRIPIWVRLLLWIAVGVLLNMIGSLVADALPLPVYLDCIGTVLASACGGLLPGVLAGFLTNIIKAGTMDPSAIYYMFANMITALITVLLLRSRKWFSVRMILGLAAVMAVVCGSYSAVLVWFKDAQAIEPAVQSWASLFASAGVSPLFGSVIGNWGLDFIDKIITVLIVTVLLFLVKKAGLYRNEQDRDGTMEITLRRMSLKAKLLLFLSIVVVGIGIAAIGIGAYLFRQSSIEDHTNLGTGAARLLARQIEPDRVDAWLKNGEREPDYAEVRERLANIRESYPDIEYVYVYQIREDGCHVVFDLDTEEIEGAQPGEIVPFDESFGPFLENLINGKPIDPIITDDTFGWLLTVYEPVYDANGKCVCYAALDVSMNRISTITMTFIAKLTALFLAALLLALGVLVWFTRRSIVTPLNRIAATAVLDLDTEEDRRRGIEDMKALSIRSGDEIEHLYNSLVSSLSDTVSYMEQSRKQAEALTKMQDGLIMVLAEVVESRDKCTGDHIKNTAVYVRMLIGEMKKEGIYGERMTQQFMEDITRSAPLHDVGKIKVPDAILNKPGRLTDEEFALMKTHTTGGTEIIDEAISIVPDSMYLEETRNLAEYHHEKWDGSGYPNGLKGEEIPLSARIMAVADVFDALVSKRSYKPGFPVEKALDIIREGAGSHFDPLIAQAFLNIEDQLREHLKEAQEDEEEKIDSE